jgi:hypothetical protein
MTIPTVSGQRHRSAAWIFFLTLTSVLCRESIAGPANAPPEPFLFTRSLQGRGNPFDGRRPINTFTDFNSDGVSELAIGQSTFSYAEVAVLDGLTGAILKQFRGRDDADSNFIESLTLMPDLDGDGTRDFLVGDPLLFPNRRGAAFSFFSGSSGGPINAPGVLNFEIPGPGPQGGFGNDTALLSDVAAVAWSDRSRVHLIDPRTGTTLAKLSGKSTSGLGFSLFNIGDVDGDGLDDLLTSDPNSGPSPGRGEVYIISGAVTTTGDAYLPITYLPTGGLIATINNQGPNGVFLGSSREAPYASLGDPEPNDGVLSSLIVSGGADGFAAHVLTETPGEAFSVNQIVSANQQSSDLIDVRHVVGVGDVNRDGLGDFALLEDFHDRVLIISGAGLLDGFDETEDVLQTILPNGSDQFVALEALGDYDFNGSFDLLIGLHMSGSAAGVRYDIYSLVVPEPMAGSIAALSLLAVCPGRLLQTIVRSRPIKCGKQIR